MYFISAVNYLLLGASMQRAILAILLVSALLSLTLAETILTQTNQNTEGSEMTAIIV